MVDFAVRTSSLALINTDLQNVFVEGSPIAAPDGLAVVARVNELSRACRQAGVLVIHTAHVTRPDGSNVGVLGEIIPPVRDGMIAQGSFPAKLHKSLVVEPSDVLLEKPRFGAFHGTDLELVLRSRGIDTVVVTGIATNVCVDSTVREANARDFKVLVPSDATATSDMNGISHRDLHRATLATLGFGFAQIVTTAEAIAKISAPKS